MKKRQQFRRNLEQLFENEHARFLARWRDRDERERIRQLDFDHPERDHIVAPNNAPANVNLFADADPVILADPCTICFAEEANYGLDRCIHRFCLTCIRRFQPQVCPVCRRAFVLVMSGESSTKPETRVTRGLLDFTRTRLDNRPSSKK